MRQKGVVVHFNSKDYDPEISDFVKIGNGSLGGKARGLAFVANLLRRSPRPSGTLPRTSPSGCLRPWWSPRKDSTPLSLITVWTRPICPSIADDQIANAFMEAKMPPWLADQLYSYLEARSPTLVNQEFGPARGCSQTIRLAAFTELTWSPTTIPVFPSAAIS